MLYIYNLKHLKIDSELIPLEDIGEDESPFLTLEEAEKLAIEKKEIAHNKKWSRESKLQVIFLTLFFTHILN